MTLPDDIATALTGFETNDENFKTASESDVYRYARGETVLFLKIQRPSWSPPLSSEKAAMEWFNGKLPVPEVVAYATSEDTEYLLTTAIPGESSENTSCHEDKQRLVGQLAASLRGIHGLPCEGCPADRTPAALIGRGRERIEAGIVTGQMVRDEGFEGTPTEALDRLEASVPSLEGPVVTHGDYCLPNVMIDDDRVSGFVDLGYAGIGDPYRDFAAARYSINRNLGENWIRPFFDAYGLTDLDENKLRWYRQIQAFD